jgi:hypothetical protein
MYLHQFELAHVCRPSNFLDLPHPTAVVACARKYMHPFTPVSAAVCTKEITDLCQVVDIRENGIAMERSTLVTVGQEVELCLSLGEFSEQLCATARVVWSDFERRAGPDFSALNVLGGAGPHWGQEGSKELAKALADGMTRTRAAAIEQQAQIWYQHRQTEGKRSQTR